MRSITTILWVARSWWWSWSVLPWASNWGGVGAGSPAPTVLDRWSWPRFWSATRGWWWSVNHINWSASAHNMYRKEKQSMTKFLSSLKFKHKRELCIIILRRKKRVQTHTTTHYTAQRFNQNLAFFPKVEKQLEWKNITGKIPSNNAAKPKLQKQHCCKFLCRGLFHFIA
jgi:hypothetical protein